MSSVAATLDDIVGLTRQVVEAAEQGAWEQAAVFDRQRREQLVSFCSGLNPSNTPAAVVAALAEILKLNDSLIGAVEHRQRAIVREADTVRVGKQAVAAYR